MPQAWVEEQQRKAGTLTVQLRGGPNDGQTVPAKGFQIEVPAAPGSQFEFHVYSYQRDEDGTLYGHWEEEANI